MALSGLGPHGERAAPADKLVLSEADGEIARNRRFSIALVIHTTESDWSRQNISGIVTTLGRHSAAVVEIIDCGFNVERQIAALERLACQKAVDAVISIPIGNSKVAEAHKALSLAGIKLVLLDNAPIGLHSGTDYAAVVSADNFGLGRIGAELLASAIPVGGTVGILSYGIDFFATHEREIAFQKWVDANRADLKLVRSRFLEVGAASDAADSLIEANPDLAGLFCVWDVPAMRAIERLRARQICLPITTVDLGHAVAENMAGGGMIRGIAAQRPYDQGSAAAIATLSALLGHSLPPWMAMPGLPVTRDNVVEAYQLVWHAPATSRILAARRLTS